MQSNNSSAVAVVTAPTTSLSGIGIIVGIILCILQGVGTINIGWFWATFPFWIMPAIGIGLFFIIWIVAFIVLLIAKLVESLRGLKKRP